MVRGPGCPLERSRGTTGPNRFGPWPQLASVWPQVVGAQCHVCAIVRAVVVLRVERDRAIKLDIRKVRKMKTSALILALLASTVTAKADLVTVTNYNLNDSDAFNSVVTEGYSYYTGPIQLVTTDGTINVFCADLDHNIYGGTTYTYAYQPLTENGQGQLLGEALSNKLGQIAAIGLDAWARGDGDEAAAAEAAIWSFEYKTTSLVLPWPLTMAANGPAILVDYESLMGATYQNTGTYALALTPFGEGWPQNSGASQQMIVGLASGVPETSTWAMMGIGFLGLAFAGFRQRKNRLATIRSQVQARHVAPHLVSAAG